LTLDIYPADEGTYTLLDEGKAPVEISYRLDREGLTLHLDGYRGQVETTLNLLPPPWDVRVNGRKTDDWEMHERSVRVCFVAEGPTEMSLKFDL
jgi:hypothetical protein